MNIPDLYHRANEAQRYDAEEIIEEYFPQIQWRPDGRDTLIDIGTGSGDVLIDFVYPRMPKGFKRLVGSDVNPRMVNYAKNQHRAIEKCDFQILNIEGKSDVTKELMGVFDHVTSFYCLHWIRNQRQAFQNIYNLLRPEGGDCLLLFLATIPIYDVYYKLRKSSKWFQYMQDIERFTCPLHSANDPEGELCAILNDLEFADYEVEIREKIHVYETEEIFRDNMKAVSPYLDRVPLRLHRDFMDDFIRAAIGLGLKQQKNNGEDMQFVVPYKLAVVYARKSNIAQ